MRPDHSHDVDVVVIGGGAAGLMCAAVAGQRGRRTVLLEHNERLGQKILISGGGRCNFTNLHTTPENYLSGEPDFCRSALARYTPQDFIDLVESHGVAYHEKKLGQQFCDQSSRAIVELLLAECAQGQVQIQTACQVQAVRKSDRFHVETNQGQWQANSLVIATGGLSFPKLGATDFGYRLAHQFGLRTINPRAGLVPLSFTPKDLAIWSDLSGLSLPVVAQYQQQAFAENMLFTHRGLSGPAILQISSYWKHHTPLEINLLPEVDATAWLQSESRTGKKLSSLLTTHWPQRLADRWCEQAGIDRPLAQLSAQQLKHLGHSLNHSRWNFAGTEGYPKAEVTLGGIATSELSSKTMESRQVPGLYFIGEVVDVTGWLGGYNFQWAWASAQAAGQFV